VFVEIDKERTVADIPVNHMSLEDIIRLEDECTVTLGVPTGVLGGGRASKAATRPHRFSANLLSKREEEVVRFIAEGLSNRDIAQALNLSEHTIKNHLFHIFEKLGVSNRVELVCVVPLLGTRTDMNAANMPKSPAFSRRMRMAVRGIQ